MPIALPLLLQFSEGGAMAQSRPDWMWAQALQLLDQAERAHRDLFRPSGTRRRTACWEPPVDVFETDAEVWVQVALPGVATDQVEVRLEDGGITVAGERTLPTPRGAGVIRRLEMPHGCFERRIALAAGRYELTRRELAQGCLTLTLRKLG
ncbi:MAG: Hsp20/alpha crystallin family protein [Geminicoccaceae bacterium]